MSWLSRIANAFRSSGVDRALDEEMTFHIESRIADLVASGIPLLVSIRRRRAA
jgi:hypothetical protein